MPPPVIRVLDLCCGTKSVERTLRRVFEGHDIRYVGVDFDPSHSPTVLADVRAWDWRTELPPLLGGPPDIVWASPPCTQYSVARTRGPPRDLELADSIVEACLRIINDLSPRLWFLENPASGKFALRTRPLMQPYEARRRACSYCRYGFAYRKHTDIWTNAAVALKACSHGDPCEHIAGRPAGDRRHPVCAQGGEHGPSRPPGQAGLPRLQAYAVPHDLMRELLCSEPANM